MQRRQIQHAGAALLFFTAIFTAPPAGAEIEFTTLALEGDSAPGLAVPFTSFTAPLLAGSRYAFGGTSGFLGSSTNPLRTGLFAGSAGLYNSVLLDTDDAPGAPGTRFRFTQTSFSFSPTAVSQINATGALAFTGELTGAGVNSTQSDTLNQRGVWSTTFDEKALEIEMRANNPAPAFGDGWRFSLPGPVALNANNAIAFWAAVKRGNFPATETKTGLFSRESGLVEFNVLFDDTMVIPGLPTTFQQAQPAPSGQVIDLPAPVFNKLGSALVMIDFANPAYHFGGRAEALLVASPQGLQVVAHTASNPFDVPVPTGNVAPGLPGTVFSDLLLSRLNDLGDVALMARTRSAPGTAGVFGIGVWAGAPGQLQLIAREGQTVAEGVRTKEDSGRAPLKLLQFNDLGQVALHSELAVEGEDPFGIITGLLRGDATALDLIARSGAGGAFEGAEFTSFDDVALNNRGQLAFLAGRRGTLLSETFTALMLSDLDGLRTLVRTGTDIEVRPGDLRKVRSIDVSSRYLGDNGDYAYKLQFSDGKDGIFVAQAGTVRGTDFFLRNAGPGGVHWLDAQWKDSLDFDTSEPGFLGNEIVTIENSNVRIISDAGASTLTIGRLNSTGSLELGEVLGGGPSLILNHTDDGDSNLQSLVLRGGELRARHDVLLSGNSEFISGRLSTGDNVTITNSAELLVKQVGAAGNGLLVNASPGRMVFGSGAFMGLSDGMKLINLGALEVSAGDIEAASFLDETVRNEGSFIKHADTSAPQDIFRITAGFENTGVVEIEGGELDLAPIVSNNEHRAGARYTLSSGEGTVPATLRFRGIHTMTGDVSIESTPSGRWILDGATLDLSQAELNVNANALWRTVTVKGADTTTEAGRLGELRIKAGHSLKIEQSEVFGKTSRFTGVLAVDGTVVQKDADLLLDHATVILEKQADSSAWVLEGDANVLTDRKSDFINRNGTLSKRGSGASRFEAFYTGGSGKTGGSGEIRVTEGSLTFAGGGDFMGRITLDETAGGASTVRLVDDTNSPQFTALALLSVIGEEGGEFSIENGAELRVNKDSGVIFNVTGRGVRLAGGTLSGFSPAFSGGFNNRGHMHWTSGVIGVPGLGEKSGELFNEGGRAVLLIDGAAGERVLAGTLLNNGRIEQSGDLVLSGGLIFYGSNFANSHWSLSADIVVDGLGGRIELINGALLEVAADKQVSIAADFSNRGEVHLQANSKLAVTGAVTQNALGVLTGGKWKLDSDSRLSLAGGPIEKIGAGASVTLAKRSVFEGLELVANDGTLELDSLAELETAADFTNAGELRVKEGSSLFVNGTFDNSGEVFSGNGAIVVKVLENRGTMTLSSGTLSATVLATNKGNMTLHRMVVNGGVIFANAPGATLILQNTRLNAETLSLQGTFRGTGVLNGEVHNFGTLAPGASPGTIEINGDFIAEAGSTLVVEFAGLGDGEFDLIEVHGDAALDGTLEIRFLDGFLPTRGDQLDFLAIDGSLTGAFAQFLFPELAPGFEFATQFADGRFGIVALTDAAAVPIPPAAGLLSAGLALLWARRHRAGGIGTKSASQAIKI